jgi:hypothetical protein
MTYLDTLFTPPGPSLVLTADQISQAASLIGLTPTKEQLDELCDGHISAIMFHAAAKAGRFGSGVVLDGAAEDWHSGLGGSCDECEGVPPYSLASLDRWDEPYSLLSWDDLRWAIHWRLTNEERADANEEFGEIPEVAELGWVRQFVEEAVQNDDIETACGLVDLTLGENNAYGAYTVSGYSFSGISIKFYGATYDNETAIAWRINRLGILQESDITEATLQLLDFAALRTDVLEHWAKEEAADAKGGNS